MDWVKTATGWVLDIVKRSDDQKGFIVLPKRWIVERRLSKDSEEQPQRSGTTLYIAMIQLMLKGLDPVA